MNEGPHSSPSKQHNLAPFFWLLQSLSICLSRVSLHGGPERPLSKAGRLNPGFAGEAKIGDARVFRYSQGRLLTGVNQPERERCGAANRAGRSWELKTALASDVEI